MKKALFTFLLLFAATAMNAQTIVKGDMDGDGEVTITDVTSAVDVILGKAPKETVSQVGAPYAVDNSFVVGTWRTSDRETSFTLSEDGSTNFTGASTYKFRPYQGTLMFFNDEGKAVKTIVLNEVVKGSYLLAVNYVTDTYTYYYCDKSGSIDGRDYVDLGLPSGTLWATCNVGASSPEDYGDYFAWGETEPYDENGKTFFGWSTYKWCEGSISTMTKYCISNSYGNDGFTDGKTELDVDDDAAYVNWGTAWCMPSSEQFDELCTKCTWTWTVKNNVNGYEVKGTNGNSIFLPAAGRRDRSSLDVAGSGGLYWSRALDESYSSGAWYLGFLSAGFGAETSRRCVGLSVRPVRFSE